MVHPCVGWQQGKVAPGDKTQKKGTKRALECSWSFGAAPEEPHEAPKWGPRASQEELCGVQKSYKNNAFSTIRGLEASQGGTKQEDQHEAQQEGP